MTFHVRRVTAWVVAVVCTAVLTVAGGAMGQAQAEPDYRLCFFGGYSDDNGSGGQARDYYILKQYKKGDCASLDVEAVVAEGLPRAVYVGPNDDPEMYWIPFKDTCERVSGTILRGDSSDVSGGDLCHGMTQDLVYRVRLAGIDRTGVTAENVEKTSVAGLRDVISDSDRYHVVLDYNKDVYCFGHPAGERNDRRIHLWNIKKGRVILDSSGALGRTILRTDAETEDWNADANGYIKRQDNWSRQHYVDDENFPSDVPAATICKEFVGLGHAG